jgi:ATP-binding protein involved in chromosome partitioning
VINEAAVLDALRGVQDPTLGKDVVSLKFVKNLQIDGGRVAFAIELAAPGPSAKAQVREGARAAVAAIPGVSAVSVDVIHAIRPTVSSDMNRQPVAGVRNIVAVGAGKGGVGKTTVSVNLAIALSQMGARVAMIDGDVYGPNVPIMLGINTQLQTDGQKIVPAEQYGIQLVSMAFLAGDDAPVIWRGPMLHGVINQFFREVRWENIDYLIVDMPPGTGDIALSLSQSVPVSGAVVVTTPQTVSVADTRRAIRMYQKLNVPPIGLVENMSHFVCPTCSTESDIFGKGGGESLADEMSVPFLGRVPIHEPIRVGGDTGVPITIGDPKSAPAAAFRNAAERLAAQLAVANHGSAARRAIPLTQVRQ